jgi:hypothetical protein
MKEELEPLKYLLRTRLKNAIHETLKLGMDKSAQGELTATNSEITSLLTTCLVEALEIITFSAAKIGKIDKENYILLVNGIIKTIKDFMLNEERLGEFV